MKILAWNVYGAKKRQIREEVRLISRIHKPNLLSLMETMVTKNVTRRSISLLGFDHYDYFNPINHGDGI